MASWNKTETEARVGQADGAIVIVKAPEGIGLGPGVDKNHLCELQRPRVDTCDWHHTLVPFLCSSIHIL